MIETSANNRTEKTATADEPFHFLDSGLSYVYLVGVKYYVYADGRVAADIPAVKQLMQAIARDLLTKNGSLTGEEIRFLRKRLGKKQADFANDIGVEPETFNRYENDKQTVSEASDKLIRFVYLLFSGDQNLSEAKAKLEELLRAWHVSSRPKKIIKRVHNNAWKDEPTAA